MADLGVAKGEIQFIHGVRKRICAQMFGMEQVVDLLLIALVTRGHVLLESNPGLGKTALARSLTTALSLNNGLHDKPAFGRIQFTPDLMPSDITGTKMPDAENKFTFQPGPIFHQILLADEINRATPKTQAAMLEAMAEEQVTVLGEQKSLVASLPVSSGNSAIQVRTPFMVVATQNPVDQEGTYSLPEAQLDRFLFKAKMPIPDALQLQWIIDKDVHGKVKGDAAKNEGAGSHADGQATLAQLHRLGALVRGSRPSNAVRQHILNIVLASVRAYQQLEGLASGRAKSLHEYCEERVDYPLGPRAAVAMTRGALGWAMVAGLDPDGFESGDITAKSAEGLAATIVAALRHRIRFRHAYSGMEDEPADHDDEVRRFVALCAPSSKEFEGYHERFEAAIKTPAVR